MLILKRDLEVLKDAPRLDYLALFEPLDQQSIVLFVSGVINQAVEQEGLG